MVNERKCSVCGGTGHDARNCPVRDAQDPNNKIVWYKIANLSDKQANKMTTAVMNAKQRIAPTADGAFVKGDKLSLPERILKAIGLNKDDE